MTTSDEKVEKRLEKVLKELERESNRDVIETDDGSTTRLELRSTGWAYWIVAGPVLLFALWILAASVLSLFQNDNGARPAVASVVVSTAFALIALVFASVRETVAITPYDLVLSSGTGRLKFNTHVPLEAIRGVRVGAFSFASWDPYVVVATEYRSYRFAWGVSGRDGHEIARVILQALPPGG